MPATDYLKKTTTKPDIQTSSGIREFAASKGVDLPEPKKRSGFLGGIGKIIDILRTGEFAVGGTLSGKGPIAGIKEKISPSDVIFKGVNAETRFGKIVLGTVKFATDVLADPLTYLTFGAGGAIKGVAATGTRVALSKTGKELTQELAEEIIQKSSKPLSEATQRQIINEARDAVAQLATKEAAQTTLQRGGLVAITKALDKVGIEVTRETVEKVLREGIEELRAPTGIKIFGQEIVKAATLKRPFVGLDDALRKTSSGRDLMTGIENISSAIGKTFNRDFGLPEGYKLLKQNYIDSYDSAIARMKQNLKLIFKNTSKIERESISVVIEKGSKAILKLPKELQPLANRTKQIFESIAIEEEKRGLLDTTLEDYVTHIYKNKERAKSLIKELHSGQPSGLLRFAQNRSIPSIEDAEKLGLEPIKDIAEILAVRLMASEKAKLTQDFFMKVGKDFSIPASIKASTKTLAKTPAKASTKIKGKAQPRLDVYRKIIESRDNITRFGDVATGIPKEFRNLELPAHIANDIAKMGAKFFSDESANLLLRGYDKALNFFKGSVTVMFPSFHGRNAISNTILNFMDIGVSAFNPKRWKQAIDVMIGKEGKIITELGDVYSYAEIRKIMNQKQIYQDRLLRTDVGRIVDPNVLKREGVFGGGRAVGRAIENEGRLINFIKNIQRGLSPDDAAARTKQFLFDYDNLSNFEKEVMRRLIPFYTFTRKNIAVQLKTLITNPKRVINQGRALQTIGEIMGFRMTEEEKKFAPQYVQQGLFTLLQRKGDDRTFLIGFDLPFEDAFEKFNLPLKSALTMLTPFLKAPLEMGTGRNFFTEKNIKDDDSGNFAQHLPKNIKEWLDYNERTVTKKDGTSFILRTVDPQRKWIFQNVSTLAGVSRAISGRTLQQLTIFQKALTGEKITLEERFDMVSFFTGVRAITTNIEAEKAKSEKVENREHQDILERKGEIGRFERVFIPQPPKNKAPQGATRFLNP
jgi:hypothetical protein